jgi:predicted flap endonuclease-1-like 5' DNA nuclease
LILLVLLWIASNKGNQWSNTTTTNTPRPTRGKAKTTGKKKIMKKGAKDNLTKIEGIWPKVQTILYAAGITTYAQLANTKIRDIRDILQENNLARFDPKHWKKQATLAKNGKRDKLKAFQKTI